MNIELKSYKKKYFWRFLIGILNYRILKNSGIFKREFYKRWIKRIFSKQKLGLFNFVILLDKRLVGGVQLGEVSKGKWLIGFDVFKKYWNRGIATIAIRKALIFAKKKRIKKIRAEVFYYNEASLKIMKKIGFKKVGEYKKNTFWEKKI